VAHGHPEGVIVPVALVPNSFALQDLVIPALAPKAQAAARRVRTDTSQRTTQMVIALRVMHTMLMDVARHVQMQHHRVSVQLLLVQGMDGMVRAVRRAPAVIHGLAQHVIIVVDATHKLVLVKDAPRTAFRVQADMLR